jgi:hypothetical protein
MILVYLKINHDGRINMKKKILGIFVCMLLIITTVIPAAGIIGAGNIKIKSTSPPISMRVDTYVDEISPYNIHSSPLTITATGPSDLEYVSLYYRWSKNNMSWEGLTEITIFEGFTTGNQNTELWNTHQSGSSQARIQWDWSVAHSGSYSCAMDDADSGNDFALNVIYTNIDFTNATEISIDFWEREWGDEYQGELDSWEGWGNYDTVAFTNDGNTWHQLVSEQELSTSSFTQHHRDIHEDPDFSSPANSNFAIAFQQYDNAQLTNDGRAWDDIFINYTIGGGINWTFLDVPSNPDFSYPWSWNFNFPNGTGYYEFYSLGKPTGEDEETPPLVADARCRFNLMPEISDENPVNGSTDIDLLPTLNISINDPEGDTMTINWYSNSSGSWQVFGSNSSVGDGTYSQINSNFSDFGTTYWWHVSVNDGINTKLSPIFHFTTKINLPPYTPSNPYPEDDETDVNVDVDFSWSGGDPNDDDVTYDVYLDDVCPPTTKVSSNQSGTSYNPGLLEFDTTYCWKIVAWDEFGYSTSGPVWSFTTEENLPPNTPSNPDPEDGEIDVSINELLRWTGGDPNSGDKLTYDIYFGTDSSPPLVGQTTQPAYDPGIMNLETMYYWKIVVTDSGGLTDSGPTWSFTTEKEPNEPPTKPDIYGPPRGPPKVELCWAFESEDPNEQEIKFLIEWGDGESTETEYSFIAVEACHSYDEEGEYTIKAKAIDIKGAESDWSTLDVTMPKNKVFNFNFPLLKWLFERFPHAFPVLRYMLGQ